MKSITGKSAIVNKPAAMTHLKPCVIEEYVPDIKKYEVSFDGSWVGYYSRFELLIDNPTGMIGSTID